MNPQFPIYVPSKGRAAYRITQRYLSKMRVPYRVVVEEPELQDYVDAGEPRENILVLDPAYKRDYDTCDDLGDSLPVGAGAARNFAWDHAVSEGHEWHWTIDDNVRGFVRLHVNEKIALGDGTGLRCMEDFCLRYTNVAMAGPQYEMFCPRRQKFGPFALNTRIYSCNLIRCDVPFRWRGRYNEDTILSLDMLKAGWCTVQFNAFLQCKMATQRVAGGNTDTLYAAGTRRKSEMMMAVHPDVSRLMTRWNRDHHYVDYRPFRKNKLIRRPDVVVPASPDDYGMRVAPRTRMISDPNGSIAQQRRRRGP